MRYKSPKYRYGQSVSADENDEKLKQIEIRILSEESGREGNR